MRPDQVVAHMYIPNEAYTDRQSMLKHRCRMTGSCQFTIVALRIQPTRREGLERGSRRHAMALAVPLYAPS